MVVANDCGDYYRIPADTRDLNYDKFFTEGEQETNYGWEYNSHNTTRLGIEEVKCLLLKLDYIQQQLALR